MRRLGQFQGMRGATPRIGPSSPPPTGNPWVDIAGCRVWLDARNAVNDGSGKASSCPNSAGGTDFTQGTSANRLTIAGSPQYLDTAGATAWLACAGMTDVGNNPYTVVMRARVTTFATGYYTYPAFKPGATTCYISLGLSTAVYITYRSDLCTGGSAANVQKSAAGTINTWYTVAATFDGSSTIELFKNGSSLGTGTLSKSLSGLTTYCLGYPAGTSTIKYGMAAYWPRVLSAADIATIHTYMAAVYV